MSEYAVVADHVSKCYKMYENKKDRLKDLLGVHNVGEKFYAIKDISFQVKKGKVVGLVGLNGSGKSTLADMIAGISVPTEGNISIAGVPSMIAISSGLNNNLTGMENIEVKGLMIGLTPKEIDGLKESIIEFADIGKFINQPVKTYSSGMKSRLGFAISVNVNPDILVIDEALSVGDSVFANKCLARINLFKEEGKTIFFVSHSISQVRDFCTEAIWLEYGRIKAMGMTEEVLPMYERFTYQYNRMSEKERKEYRDKILEAQNHLLLRN